MKYYLEDTIEVEEKHRMLIRNEGGTFERYDKKAKKWVEDDELFGIFWGSPEVEEITEKEANRLINEVYK